MSTAHPNTGAGDIEAILTAARAFNPSRNITGMLLYVEGQFLQYLEGEEAAVEALYDKIEKDRRHSGVMRLFASDCPRRGFEDWSMGFRSIDRDALKSVEGVIDLCRQSVREAVPSGAPEEITLFMESFYRSSMRSPG